MNWYLIAYDIFTSESGGPPRFAQEQKQFLGYLENLAITFAESRSELELDEHELFHLGLKKIEKEIVEFETRSTDDEQVTRSFKVWMSKLCQRLWTDECKKVIRKNDYENEHYSTGDYDENNETIEIADPVDMDPLVINAECRSLMRLIARDVLDIYPEYKRNAILQYRSTRKGRNGLRGFEGETASIASDVNASQAQIRQWSHRFKIACLSRYEQEKRNVKSNKAASRK